MGVLVLICLVAVLHQLDGFVVSPAGKHHVRNSVRKHRSPSTTITERGTGQAATLKVMPKHLLDYEREGVDAWAYPAEGEKRKEGALTLTILDEITQLPTVVNFAGPRPDRVLVDPPPSDLTDAHSCASAEEFSRGTFVDLFRGSAPYLRMHRGQTFVLHIPGEVIEKSTFLNIMDDVGLLNLLGVHLVLVVGSRPQADSLMKKMSVEPAFCGNTRITSAAALKVAKEAAGFVRFEVESSLTRGQRSANTVNVSSGNFFAAQPVGIRNGVDYGFTGEVRKVDAGKIRARLDTGNIVQLTSIGFSSSGEVFQVSTEELAAEVAVELGADKLIYFTEGQQMVDKETKSPVKCLRMREAREILSHFGENFRSTPAPEELDDLLDPEHVVEQSSAPSASLHNHAIHKHAHMVTTPYPASHPHGQTNYTASLLELVDHSVRALSNGVPRAHMVSPTNGALLQELFTRDGSGLLISRDIYDGIRPATMKDVQGIMNIIRPLEKEGILVERSREQLEAELGNFFVFVRDGDVLACAYLKRYSEKYAEVGCLAVHPKYRKGGRGEAMLGYLERVSVLSGIDHIFVLSTRTMEWFVERGFVECSVTDLPESRRRVYNTRRKSKVFMKPLAGTREIDAEELFWDIKA